MALPVEIHEKILRILPVSDLAAMCRCSKAYHGLAVSHLYRNISIRSRTGDLDWRTMALLNTLCSNSAMRHYIRQVEVYRARSTSGISDHSKLLGMILSIHVFTEPCRIQHFAWKFGSICLETVFPSLNTLECGEISSEPELGWTKWHLTHCRLRKLSLALSCRTSGDVGKWLLHGVAMPFAEELCIEYMDISELDPLAIAPLRKLELNLCSGASLFLERWMRVNRAQRLTSLKIAANLPLEFLHRLMSFVSQRSRLRELALRIGGVTETLKVASIAAHATTLELLVLDFRHVITDTCSTVKYTLHEFEGFLGRFLLLRAIGLPLELRDAHNRRKKFQTKLPLAQQLGVIHLRGNCVPLRRSRSDAQYVAQPFRHRGDFLVLLDHGSRLRKMVFDSKRQRNGAATDEERLRLNTDLSGLF